MPYADVYLVQVATDAAFSHRVLARNNVGAPQADISGLTPAVTYYWRASAGVQQAATVAWGGWSAARSFTTAMPQATAPTFTLPAGQVAAGTMVSMTPPTAGALISFSTDGGATWSTPAGPVSYTVNAAVTVQAKAIATGLPIARSPARRTPCRLPLPPAAAPTFAPPAGRWPPARW